MSHSPVVRSSSRPWRLHLSCLLIAATLVAGCRPEDLTRPKHLATSSNQSILDGVVAPPPIGNATDPGPSNRVAYAFADQPTAASYWPQNVWSYAGGPIKVQRIGVGHYAVDVDYLSNYVH